MGDKVNERVTQVGKDMSRKRPEQVEAIRGSKSAANLVESPDTGDGEWNVVEVDFQQRREAEQCGMNVLSRDIHRHACGKKAGIEAERQRRRGRRTPPECRILDLVLRTSVQNPKQAEDQHECHLFHVQDPPFAHGAIRWNAVGQMLLTE